MNHSCMTDTNNIITGKKQYHHWEAWFKNLNIIKTEESSFTMTAMIKNSYETRLKYLTAKTSDNGVVNIHLILVNEETNRNGILLVQVDSKNKSTAKELMEKISQHASDPILGKQRYSCICLDNALVLEDSKPLQNYFLPSVEKQFAIAVPTGKTSCRSVDLAMPVIQNARDVGTNTTDFMKEQLMLSKEREQNNSPLVIKCFAAGDKAPRQIHIPHTVYMVMALIFIFVMQVYSN